MAAYVLIDYLFLKITIFQPLNRASIPKDSKGVFCGKCGRKTDSVEICPCCGIDLSKREHSSYALVTASSLNVSDELSTQRSTSTAEVSSVTSGESEISIGSRLKVNMHSYPEWAGALAIFGYHSQDYVDRRKRKQIRKGTVDGVVSDNYKKYVRGESDKVNDLNTVEVLRDRVHSIYFPKHKAMSTLERSQTNRVLDWKTVRDQERSRILQETASKDLAYQLEYERIKELLKQS